jgi:hypothetical protein
MITITKSMVGLSALIAAGLVAAVDTIGSRAEDQSAAAQVAQRFPLASEMFSSVPMTTFAAQKLAQVQAAKTDRLPLAESCDGQSWPYFSHECLMSGDGTATPKVNRVITIERRVGDNVSELMRMPVSDLAQR